MTHQQSLIERFEADRSHLRAVAYRLLGSLHDAEDAVQAAWLKVSQRGIADVQNPTGWFTTVTARECLDRLRAEKRRGEVLVASGNVLAQDPASPPDDEVALAESVGRALLVVLDRLSPTQRVAFVLHDIFDMSFDDIGQLLERSPVAARKLASRAREHLHGSPTAPHRPTAEHLRIAQAFLSASQHGDLAVLLQLLAPDVVRRVDRVLVPQHVPTDLRSARKVAEETRMFAGVARGGEVAVVDGMPGIVVAPAGRLKAVLRLTIRADRIQVIDIIGDEHRLVSVEMTLAH